MITQYTNCLRVYIAVKIKYQIRSKQEANVDRECTAVVCYKSKNNLDIIKQTSKKTEQAIKNGQSRENDNTGQTRHRTKTNKTK